MKLVSHNNFFLKSYFFKFFYNMPDKNVLHIYNI